MVGLNQLTKPSAVIATTAFIAAAAKLFRAIESVEGKLSTQIAIMVKFAPRKLIKNMGAAGFKRNLSIVTSRPRPVSIVELSRMNRVEPKIGKPFSTLRLRLDEAIPRITTSPAKSS